MNNESKNSTTGYSPFISNAASVIVISAGLSVSTSALGAMVPPAEHFDALNDTKSIDPNLVQELTTPDYELSTASAIAELHRLSGLPWNELAKIFGTSRRALHFWASGKAMTTENESRLLTALATVRHIDRGTASLNRTALLTPLPDGTLPIIALSCGQDKLLISALGKGRAAAPIDTKKFSKGANDNPPPSPDALVDGSPERSWPSSGVLRKAEPIGRKRS